jgi:hypothetical protein
MVTTYSTYSNVHNNGLLHITMIYIRVIMLIDTHWGIILDH